MRSRCHPRQNAVAAGLLLAALAVGGCSSASSPAQPTPPAFPETLTHFEALVGTSWAGTATYLTGGEAEPSRVSLAFLWGGVCDNPYYMGCADGYNPYGFGALDGHPLRILGYPDRFVVGQFRREIYVGQSATLGNGNWDGAVISTDGQRLVVTSSDFAWGQRRGVRLELARAPWPADLKCPSFRTCAP